MPSQALQQTATEQLKVAGIPYAIDPTIPMGYAIQRSGNITWLEANRDLVLKLARSEIEVASRDVELPPGSRVYIVPSFVNDKIRGAGYKVIVVGSVGDSWKCDAESLKPFSQLEKRLNESKSAVSVLALTSELKGFGSFLGNAEAQCRLGNLELCQLLPSRDKRLLFAKEIDHLHNPGVGATLGAAIRTLTLRDEGRSPKDLGLMEVNVPMLVLPLSLQRLVGEHTYRSEVLRRVMISEWGETPGDNRSDRESRYFWWYDQWGMDKAGVDGQKSEQFSKYGDYAVALPFERVTEDTASTCKLNVDAVSLRVQHLASLTRDLAAFFETRLRVQNLPHDWSGLERVGKNDLGPLYDQAKELDETFGLVKGIKLIGYFGPERIDDFKKMYAAEWKGLTEFNSQHLKLEPRAFEHAMFFGTRSSRWNLILTHMVDTFGDFPISTAKIDSLTEYFGVPIYEKYMPPTLLAKELQAADHGKTYRDWIPDQQLVNSGVMANPQLVDVFYLNRPLKHEYVQQMLDDALDMLTIRFAEEFEFEFVENNVESLSYKIQIKPLGMDKSAAEESDKLFRLEISNPEGRGRIVFYRRDLNRIRSERDSDFIRNALSIAVIGGSALLAQGRVEFDAAAKQGDNRNARDIPAEFSHNRRALIPGCLGVDLSSAEIGRNGLISGDRQLDLSVDFK